MKFKMFLCFYILIPNCYPKSYKMVPNKLQSGANKLKMVRNVLSALLLQVLRSKYLGKTVYSFSFCFSPSLSLISTSLA